MVGWQRHLQCILRQAGKRYQQNQTAPFNSLFHSKATPALGEAPYLPRLQNTLTPCISRPLYQYLQHLRLSSTRTLLADSSADATPISSPLTPLLTSSTGSTEAEKAISKPSKVQAVLKGIKQPTEVALFTGYSSSRLRLGELLFFFDNFGAGDSLHASQLIHPLPITSHQHNLSSNSAHQGLDRSEEFTNVPFALYWNSLGSQDKFSRIWKCYKVLMFVGLRALTIFSDVTSSSATANKCGPAILLCFNVLSFSSPKKVNLVAALVRGMRVEDALLQLQVTVKRAAKTVYQVIHSARANAVHNHGFDPDRLLVAEAFLGKGLFKKRLSYHAKGKCGMMVRPECRLTVVLREITPEEEAEIAKLRVSNFKKLTKREKRLVPHKLIETTPIWNRKGKARSSGTGAVAE